MERLQHWWQSLSQGQNADWIQNIALLLALSLVVWGIWLLVCQRLEHVADKTKMRWDNAFIHAVQRPVSFLIWAWPILFALQILVENITHYDGSFLQGVREIVLVFGVVWSILRLIAQVEAQLIETGRDYTTINAIAKVLRLLVCVMGGLALMQQLGLSLSGILTFGGVGGLIVGMAAKDLLANFFGG